MPARQLPHVGAPDVARTRQSSSAELYRSSYLPLSGLGYEWNISHANGPVGAD